MKILYIMHIDWNWIKQRPQFVAEGLSKKGCQVDVLYKKDQRKLLVTNTTVISSVQPIRQLRGSRFFIISKINHFLYKYSVTKMVNKDRYDYIYITHPSLFIEGLNIKYIYDCMDDNVEFSMTNAVRKTIIGIENKLVRKANVIFFTSEYLKKTIIKRTGFTPQKYKVINNAINLPPANKDSNFIKLFTRPKSDFLVLSYIGTIAEWLDVDLLREVQKKYKKKIIFNLYGPIDFSGNFSDLNLKGPINHDEIFSIMEHSDILIMPFILNELIKSVNPVKLYEYIYSGKPVISVEYEETMKFNDFVYLYKPSDPNSFIDCLEEIEKNNYKTKNDYANVKKFIEQNTWESRLDEIFSMIQV